MLILTIAYGCYRRRRFLRFHVEVMNSTQNFEYNNSGILNPTAVLYPHINCPQIGYPVLNQNFVGASIPPLITYNQNLIEISQSTFTSVVPLVTLDEYFTFHGERICAICKSEFSPKFDHRMLPCKHVFHGECIYKHMIIQNQKFCPIDNVQYR